VRHLDCGGFGSRVLFGVLKEGELEAFSCCCEDGLSEISARLRIREIFGCCDGMLMGTKLTATISPAHVIISKCYHACFSRIQIYGMT
jgi:hypothetical protein